MYKDGASKLVRNPADFPDLEERAFKVAKLQEPMVLATLIFPDVSIISSFTRFTLFILFIGIHGQID